MRPDKALVVEENHTQASALGGMPYLASLADTPGQTTAYRAVSHPSLPNYLALVGGSTFGVSDDRPPADHPVTGDSVLDLTIAAGATAKAYLEDMPGRCTLESTGDYAVKHNPLGLLRRPGSPPQLPDVRPAGGDPDQRCPGRRRPSRDIAHRRHPDPEHVPRSAQLPALGRR